MKSAPVVRAMTLVLAAMVMIPVMDAIAKHLGEELDVPPATVALGRFTVQVALLLILIPTIGHRFNDHRRVGFVPAVPWVHLTRGALHGASSLTFFVAVKYMPLADTIAVFFVEPMILLVLSALFLGEYVGWPRRFAVLVGFLGAMLVVQPSYELFGAVSLLPLLAAFFFALYLLFTRRFGGDEHPLTMQLWSGLGAISLITVVVGLAEFVRFDDYRFDLPNRASVFSLLVVAGSISLVAHVQVVVAYTTAPASVLAPLNYVEIVTATLLGYLAFGDFPGALQWTGIAIIVATGLFIFFRERYLERHGAVEADR